MYSTRPSRQTCGGRAASLLLLEHLLGEGRTRAVKHCMCEAKFSSSSETQVSVCCRAALGRPFAMPIDEEGQKRHW